MNAPTTAKQHHAPQHFTSEEFRDWAYDMSPRLITMLDVLRFQLGSPIEISDHPDSLGRELGRNGYQVGPEATGG